jgi:hypothetical protein
MSTTSYKYVRNYVKIPGTGGRGSGSGFLASCVLLFEVGFSIGRRGSVGFTKNTKYVRYVRTFAETLEIIFTSLTLTKVVRNKK